MMRSNNGQGGLTLVELIIVLIIIGILAALALPQFISSTQDAKEAVLRGNLVMWRSAISLYYHQHRSTYPGAVKEDGSGDPTGAADNPQALYRQLRLYTDAAGKTSAVLDRANFPLGPYAARRGVPENPLAAPGANPRGVTVTADADPLTADPNLITGWKYSKVTGEIIANVVAYQDW